MSRRSAAVMFVIGVVMFFSLLPIVLKITGTTGVVAAATSGRASYEWRFQPPFSDIFPIYFKTYGVSTLQFLPHDESRWNDDILLWGLWCGNEVLQPKKNGKVYFIEDYECEEQTHMHVLLRKPGMHRVRVIFGITDEQIYTAYEPEQYRVLTTGLAR